MTSIKSSIGTVKFGGAHCNEAMKFYKTTFYYQGKPAIQPNP